MFLGGARRLELSPCNTGTRTPPPSTDEPRTNRHGFRANTQDTTRKHVNPQASHTRHRQWRCDHNSAAIRLHTHMRAHQTLNQHATVCMQHRRHADLEHSPKACMVQQRDEQGTPPPYRALRRCPQVSTSLGSVVHGGPHPFMHG